MNYFSDQIKLFLSNMVTVTIYCWESFGLIFLIILKEIGLVDLSSNQYEMIALGK